MRSLMPSRSALSADSCNSATAAVEKFARPRSCVAASRSTPSGKPPRRLPASAASARTRRSRHHQLDGLGEPHRPGDDRGEGKPDHHRLHQRIGAEEHAPRREIARQVRRRPPVRALGAAPSRRRSTRQRKKHGTGPHRGVLPIRAMTVMNRGLSCCPSTVGSSCPPCIHACWLRRALLVQLHQNFCDSPAKKPRRGPNCGANTPMPEPSLI